jgi:hypothetical protein
MGYWLDYSAGTLSAATIKAAGYEGVIRYVTAPRLMNPPGRNPKHTTKAEFDDHRRNGLKQLLVFQGGTTDADTGYSGGRDRALLALEGAQYLGYTGPIFFCNDRTTVPYPELWRSYLDGAAAVLGRGRVGAYGFGNAMDLAVGHASFFWQAGRRSEVRKHVNFWQDNNIQVTVGGITCDRNLPLVPMGGETEEDMPFGPDDFKHLFYAEKVQEFGNFSQLLDEIKNKARSASADAAAAKADLATVKGALAALDSKVGAGGVDVVALAEQVAALIGPAVADGVAEELKRRLAE